MITDPSTQHRSFSGTEIKDTSKEYLITGKPPHQPPRSPSNNAADYPEWEYTPGFVPPASNIQGTKSVSVLIEHYNPDLLKEHTTEVAFAKLRGEEHRAAWDGMIINMVKMFPPIPTAGTAAWTKTIEDNDLYVLLVGWDSVQV